MLACYVQGFTFFTEYTIIEYALVTLQNHIIWWLSAIRYNDRRGRDQFRVLPMPDIVQT